jgi:hypothetical protein
MKVVCIDLYKEGDNPNFLHYYNNKYLTIGKVYDVIYANEFFSKRSIKCDDNSWLGVVDEYFIDFDEYRQQKLNSIISEIR